MDTSDSNIRFDKDGICDHCLSFDKEILPSWSYGRGHEESLDKLIKRIKKSGKNKEYDCILGMSGGIDSSYLLYLVTEKLNLRPLVFHVDGGWNSQISVNNIEKMVDGLGLDLFTEVINWEEMKDLQKSFFMSGVPHIDTPQDHAFFATMYKFASKNNISYILSGGNYSTECIRNPKEWMYYQTDSKQIRDIHDKFGKIPLNDFPLVNILWFKVYLPYIRGIKLVRLLDLMEYNKEEATLFLKDKFGFQPYPQKHFESRFTRFYEGYWLPQKFGFDTRKVQFSSLILTGQMERSEAIIKLKEPIFTDEEVRREFEYVADKLDISMDELNLYLNSENKNYKDYKNQDYIYNFGSTILKKLGIERGGKR